MFAEPLKMHRDVSDYKTKLLQGDKKKANEYFEQES